MCIRPKVFIAKDIPYEVEEYISKYCDYEKTTTDQVLTKELLYQKIADKDGVMLAGTLINEEFLKHAPNLKIVSNISVGYNNFDIDAMNRFGVIGTNTPDVLNDTVADLIFGLILDAARRISYLDNYVKQGKWNKSLPEELFGVDVHHKTLGIIGMGRIGEAVAKRARLGFDMDIIYYNRKSKPEIENTLQARYYDMNTLLSESDFVLIMTPLTDATYNLIDRSALDKMKKTAILINASRGETVDEQALYEKLKNNEILGAALDVYTKEPVEKDNPLLKLNNVVTLPHIGSATLKTRSDMAMVAAKNLVLGALGKTPPNIVGEFIK